MRAGQRYSFRADWVWALPQKSPAPQLAYELVQSLTRTGERTGYARAEDQLTLAAAAMPESDPRLRIAELSHVEYASKIAALDNDNRHVFFVIEELEREQILAIRQADHIDDKIARYDMSTRVLTLALVILSVTLLANQRHLFSAAVLISFIGAAISVSGYFMP